MAALPVLKEIKENYIQGVSAISLRETQGVAKDKQRLVRCGLFENKKQEKENKKVKVLTHVAGWFVRRLLCDLAWEMSMMNYNKEDKAARRRLAVNDIFYSAP